MRLRFLPSLMLCAGLLAAIAPAAAASPGAAQVLVRFKHAASASARTAALHDAHVGPIVDHVGGAVVARVRPGTSARAAVRRLRTERVVAWSEIALQARPADFDPNDSGVASAATDSRWSDVQWALTGEHGIDMTPAWTQAQSAGGDGGRGVTIAVLDSGVAYADRGPYRRSPDLAAKRFVRGYDFVNDDPHPNDGYGHGTFVTSEIAATANNGYGTVGVAYSARIMPVQVLNDEGLGDVVTIARGIRFAAEHGADIINLSVELSDILPDGTRVARSLTSSTAIRAALFYARAKGVLVVVAAGNSFAGDVPARRYGFLTVDVGSTTEHGCLASSSNHGPGLDLVAPGGGADAALPDDPDCQPGAAPGRDITAVSFPAGNPREFLVPPARRGTSLAAPNVSGVAALVLAARVIGRHPPPSELGRHLRATATDLGAPGPDPYYGAGLLNAAAATAPYSPPGFTPSG